MSNQVYLIIHRSIITNQFHDISYVISDEEKWAEVFVLSPAAEDLS
jgi:hypothetical protein